MTFITSCLRSWNGGSLTGDRPVRVVYSGWGTPTAAILHDDDAIVDYKLFWIACKDTQEAHYLLAIVNSDALYEAVTPLMSKGQFGPRDLQKHLWKLPIPEFDPANPLHAEVSRRRQGRRGWRRPTARSPASRAQPRHRNHSKTRAPQMAPQLPRRPGRRARRHPPFSGGIERREGFTDGKGCDKISYYAA